MNDIEFTNAVNSGYYRDVNTSMTLNCDEDEEEEVLFLTNPSHEANFNQSEHFLIYDLQNNQMQRQWSGNLTYGSSISTIQPNQDPRCNENTWPDDDICTWSKSNDSSNYISFIKHADLDKDGENELLIIPNASNQIYIYKNQGQCIFKPWRKTSTRDSLRSLEVMDLDGEGENEILALSSQGALIELFNKNQTEYQFALHKRLCQLCESDIECGSDKDLCVIPLGYVSQCSVSCNEGEQCPNGFECRFVEDRQSKQCFPIRGDCIVQ